MRAPLGPILSPGPREWKLRLKGSPQFGLDVLRVRSASVSRLMIKPSTGGWRGNSVSSAVLRDTERPGRFCAQPRGAVCVLLHASVRSHAPFWPYWLTPSLGGRGLRLRSRPPPGRIKETPASCWSCWPVRRVCFRVCTSCEFETRDSSSPARVSAPRVRGPGVCVQCIRFPAEAGCCSTK